MQQVHGDEMFCGQNGAEPDILVAAVADGAAKVWGGDTADNQYPLAGRAASSRHPPGEAQPNRQRQPRHHLAHERKGKADLVWGKALGYKGWGGNRRTERHGRHRTAASPYASLIHVNARLGG
jgi:hypothetical protein